MSVLMLCGSVRKDSSNLKLLRYIQTLFSKEEFTIIDYLHQLPLFCPQIKNRNFNTVSKLKKEIEAADAILISTPEYLHNIPAILKNALEWMTESGCFNEKKVMAFTFTPNPPRGEKAMKSLLASLTALNCNIILSEELYQTEIVITEDLELVDKTMKSMLIEAVQMIL